MPKVEPEKVSTPRRGVKELKRESEEDINQTSDKKYTVLKRTINQNVHYKLKKGHSYKIK